MSFAEHGVFRNAADDLRNIMTQDLAYCILGLHQFHGYSSRLVFKSEL